MSLLFCCCAVHAHMCQANCPSVLTIKRLRNKLFSTRVCSETPYSTVRLATYMLKSTGCPSPDYQKYWSGGPPVCRTCSAAPVPIESSTLRAQISIVDRCPRTGDTLRRLYVLQLCVLLYTLTARHLPALTIHTHCQTPACDKIHVEIQHLIFSHCNK